MLDNTNTEIRFPEIYLDDREDLLVSGLNPSLIFFAKPHLELLDAIRRVLNSATGLNFILGAPGVGKTTFAEIVCKRLNSTFNCRKIDARTLQADNPLSSVVSAQFETGCRRNPETEREVSVRSTLVRNYWRESRRSLLVIDDVHNLSLPMLVGIYDLLKRVNAEHALLQILLFGRLELLSKLPPISCARELCASANTFHLDPLTVEESEAYIRHQLADKLQSCQKQYDSETIETIANGGQGIPRKLDALIAAVIRSDSSGQGRVLRSASVPGFENPSLFNSNSLGYDSVEMGQQKKTHSLCPEHSEEWAFLEPFMNTESILSEHSEDTLDQKHAGLASTKHRDKNSVGIQQRLVSCAKGFSRYSLIAFLVSLLFFGGLIMFFGASNVLPEKIFQFAQFKDGWLAVNRSDPKTPVTRSTHRSFINTSQTSTFPVDDVFVEQRGKMINDLLKRAELHIENNDLTTPVGNSALDLYQEVLLLNPDHPDAIRGIDKIKSIFIGRARAAKAQNDIEKATENYRLALSITNNDLRRLQMLRRLKEKQITVYSKIVEKHQSESKANQKEE